MWKYSFNFLMSHSTDIGFEKRSKNQVTTPEAKKYVEIIQSLLINMSLAGRPSMLNKRAHQLNGN